MSIIVSDTGPLIALAKTNNLFILKKLFKKVIIPNAVFEELHIDSCKKGTDALRKAVNEEKWLEVYDGKINLIKQIKNTVDIGEAEAIALAKDLNKLLLIDERIGRIVAQKEHIKIIGSAGLLVLAKRKNIIQNVEKVISDLQNAGYHISKNLCKKIKELANE